MGSSDRVVLNEAYLPDAIVNLVCIIPGALLHILIIVSCRDRSRVNGRFKTSIICFSSACLFTLIPNLAMYTGFIFLIHFKIHLDWTILSCSIMRAVLWVLCPGTLTVLAFDRYCTVCRGKTLKPRTLWILYGLGPLSLFFRRIIDFASEDLVPDEICGWAIRKSRSLELFVLFAWSLVGLAALINLRVLIFLHFRRKRMEHRMNLKKSRIREANEKRVTIVYLALTVLPVIHIAPAIVVSIVREVTGIRVTAYWATAYGLYWLTYATQALILILSIRPIKHSIKTLFSMSKDSEVCESFIISRKFSSRVQSGSPTTGTPVSDI